MVGNVTGKTSATIVITRKSAQQIMQAHRRNKTIYRLLYMSSDICMSIYSGVLGILPPIGSTLPPTPTRKTTTRHTPRASSFTGSTATRATEPADDASATTAGHTGTGSTTVGSTPPPGSHVVHVHIIVVVFEVHQVVMTANKLNRNLLHQTIIT